MSIDHQARKTLPDQGVGPVFPAIGGNPMTPREFFHDGVKRLRMRSPRAA